MILPLIKRAGKPPCLPRSPSSLLLCERSQISHSDALRSSVNEWLMHMLKCMKDAGRRESERESKYAKHSDWAEIQT